MNRSKSKTSNMLMLYLIFSVLIISIGVTAYLCKSIYNRYEISWTKNDCKKIEDRHLVNMIAKYIKDHNPKVYDKLAYEIAVAFTKTNDPLFYVALARKESTFNPFALSKTGAIGILQISPIHIPMLEQKGLIKSKRDLWDFRTNIKVSQYLVNHVMKGRTLEDKLVKYLGAKNRQYISKVKQYIGELYYAQNTKSKPKIRTTKIVLAQN